MAGKRVNKKNPGNPSAGRTKGQEDKERGSTKNRKKLEASPVTTEDKNMDQELERFKDEIGGLVKSVIDGKLDARADVDKFEGGYREMVQGVNDLIDAFVAPFNVTAEYVDRISKGDIPEKITDEYKGDFNDEAARMEKAAAAGELDTRADVSQYNGAWATIVKGLNDTFEGVATPLRDIGGVLDRMAAGDLKAQVVNDYQGDYNVLKVACNELGAQLNGVQKVLDDLRGAIVEGKLDTRGEASKFKGEIAGMVDGLNGVIDAFVAPFNVMAEYVDRISKGDIPESIMDEYKGDFNEIKNNLNQCIDVMNGLLTEAEGLVNATVEGKLDTRGDEEKFPGGWGELIGRVNNLIDAFVAPFNVTAEYVDRQGGHPGEDHGRVQGGLQ